MSYYCHRISNTIMATNGGFRPSQPPQLQIKFDFSIKTEYLKYVIVSQDLGALEFLGFFPFSSDDRSATVDAAASFEEVAVAVGDALADLPLDAELVDKLLCCAGDEMDRQLPEPESLLRRHETLEIRLDVTIWHFHIYLAEEGPAAEPYLALLEEYEVDCEEEEGCCICLEELGGGGGGGAMRMPCAHVFHGGCIKEWLRRSHCCPLCRYEMPTK